MAGVYDRSIATAQRLIAKWGEDCKWQKPAPKTGGVPGYPEFGETPEPVPCKIAFFSSRDLGRGSAEFLALLQGTEVPAGKEIGLLAGGIGFTPELTDTITRADSSVISIEKIDRLAPAGIPVLYYVTIAP